MSPYRAATVWSTGFDSIPGALAAASRASGRRPRSERLHDIGIASTRRTDPMAALLLDKQATVRVPPSCGGFGTRGGGVVLPSWIHKDSCLAPPGSGGGGDPLGVEPEDGRNRVKSQRRSLVGSRVSSR
jgi:hypothetical protein